MGNNQSTSNAPSKAFPASYSTTSSPVKANDYSKSIAFQIELALEKDKVSILKNANSWPVIFVDFFHQTHPEFSYQDLDDFVAIHQATPKQIKNPINPEAKAFILVCDPSVDSYIPESVFTDKKVVAVALNVSKFTDKVFDFATEVSKNAKKSQNSIKFDELCKDDFDADVLPITTVDEDSENSSEGETTIPQERETPQREVNVEHVQSYVDSDYDSVTDTDDQFIKIYYYEKPNNQFYQHQKEEMLEKKTLEFLFEFLEYQREQTDFFKILLSKPSRSPRKLTEKTVKTPSKKVENQSKNRVVDSEGCWQDARGKWHGKNGKFIKASDLVPKNFVDKTTFPVQSAPKSSLGTRKSSETVKAKELAPKVTSSSKDRVVDSEGRWQDARGHWHGKNGKFITAPDHALTKTISSVQSTPKSTSGTKKSSETVKAKEPAAKVTSLVKDRVVSNEGCWQDAGGRWHGRDGKFIKTPDHALENSASKTISSMQSTPKSSLGTIPDYTKPSVQVSRPYMSFMSTGLYDGGSLFNGGGGSFFGGGSSSSMSGYTIDRNGRYHDAATGRFCKAPW
uniref:Uncharacterized protein n=1 Tax=Panagrolaimus sp. JU765 TaxID=591449 RepID=A0AC34QNV2_9BILA